MRLTEGRRRGYALPLVAAATAVVLFAAPAASTARGPTTLTTPDSVRPPAAAVVHAAAIWSTSDPIAEAALIRRTERVLMHRAWLARFHRWNARRTGLGGAAARVGHGSNPYLGGSVRDLVVALFSRIAGPSQVATALCVANRESRFDPYARNPHSSAAGVFQWVARSWATYSRRYGFAGHSVFDAYANIAVAAHAVADAGWGPWGGGCW